MKLNIAISIAMASLAVALPVASPRSVAKTSVREPRKSVGNRATVLASKDAAIPTDERIRFNRDISSINTAIEPGERIPFGK